MMNRNTLARGVQVVGILFAAFGGFFAGIAPPRTADAKFAVGISSFLVLILLFLVVALSKKKHRKAWIIIASCLFIIAIGAALYYKTTYDALTFEYPPGSANVEYVGGTELTPAANDYKQQHQGISNAQLIAKFGGLQNMGRVWTEVSVNNARRKLIGSYMIVVLAIAGAIFALTEGALVPIRARRG
jgi:TRAP-type uncharacterized transport system fused permease subunit